VHHLVDGTRLEELQIGLKVTKVIADGLGVRSCLLCLLMMSWQFLWDLIGTPRTRRPFISSYDLDLSVEYLEMASDRSDASSLQRDSLQIHEEHL